MRYIYNSFLDNYQCKIILNSQGLYLKDLPQFNSTKLKYCNASIHTIFKKQYLELVNSMGTNCPSKQACQQVKFSVDFSYFDWVDANGNDKKSELWIEYGDSIVEFNTDFISYDIQSLVGEIGGTLGLCIGTSFLSFAEWFIDFLNYISRKS